MHKRYWTIKYRTSDGQILLSGFSGDLFTEIEAYLTVSEYNEMYAKYYFAAHAMFVYYWIEPYA